VSCHQQCGSNHDEQRGPPARLPAVRWREFPSKEIAVQFSAKFFEQAENDHAPPPRKLERSSAMIVSLSKSVFSRQAT